MHYTLSYKTKQFFFVLIKISIVVGAFYFIYNKLANNNTLSFPDFIGFLQENAVFSTKNGVFLVVLSFLNLFFEIIKWKTLVGFVKKIDLKNAIKQNLGSLTASIFTPNRIGEYGAKAIYYPSNLRKRVMLVNLIGNVLQMGVTTIVGLIGFYFYILKYNPELNYYRLTKFLALVIGGFVIFGFGLTKSRFKIKGVSIEKIRRFIIEFPKIKLTLGFLYSVIRYALFSFQFYFLLLLFKVDISYLNAMTIIGTMYLISSIIPSIFIFDVIIKGSIAIYLFSLAGVNELIILCIITIMWLLNFVLPSLFGSYYVLSFKLPKK